METKANYVLIGAATIVGTLLILLFATWITTGDLRRGSYEYDVVFDDPVRGLSEGGEVRFNGIKVGEVQTLRLDREDPNKVVAHIRIDAQTPVRTDSVAQLNFMGITGVTFIQILAGDPKKPLLTPVNGVTPQIFTSRTLVDELFQGGQDLLGVSGDTIKKINELLSEENLAHLTQTLASIDRVATKIAEDDGLVDSATAALKTINTAAASLDSAAKSVDQALASISKDVNSVTGDASEMLAQLDPVLKDARTAMSNVNGVVTQINTNLTPSANAAIQNIGHAASDIQSMMIRLQGLLAQIEQDPSRFVYQQPPPVER